METEHRKRVRPYLSVSPSSLLISQHFPIELKNIEATLCHTLYFGSRTPYVVAFCDSLYTTVDLDKCIYAGLKSLFLSSSLIVCLISHSVDFDL
jgi:hypothetical protein